MRITQVRVAQDIGYFGEHLRRKFALRSYADRYAPAVFYGCYRKEDIEAVAEHKGFRVLVWGGSDAMRFRTLATIDRLHTSRNNPLFQIAPSSFIAHGLDRAGVRRWLRLNICPIDESLFHPMPLGKKVYCYLGGADATRRSFYGEEFLHRLQKELPDIEFLVHFKDPKPTIPHGRMSEVYAQCAAGIRLVAHDAGSCTVVEMGLMGRKVVWNGCFPNALPYRSLDDVARALRREVARAGEMDYALAEKVRGALTDDRWLYTGWYYGVPTAVKNLSNASRAEAPPWQYY